MSGYTYEDLQTKIESRITPESHLLLVHIPDGFTRRDVGAKIEYDFGRVRVFGERSIGNNKRSRFNQIHQVPSYCNISNITGKFDGNIIIITMPIIPGSKVPTQQELEEEEAKQKEKIEKDSNIPPPQSVAETKEDSSPETSTPPEDQKKSISQKGQQEKEEISSQKETQVTKVESKKEADHENSAPPEEANKDSIPQKGQQKEETSQKTSQVTKVESKKEGDHENSAPPEEANKDSIPQKGQQKEETSSQKPSQVTKVESKKKDDDHETSTTPEASKDSMSQKGDEGIVPHKATFTTDAKLQTEEENTEGLNDHERQRVGVEKEESKEDHLKKTITEKVKEIKEESKVSADNVESVIKKNIEKVKGKFGDGAERKSDKRGIYESTKTRIKDMADFTTEAVTRLANRSNNEENKQKIIYTAAAILVVGISVYASFKYRSSRRP